MAGEKWTYILLFLLFVVLTSLLKWAKQTKGQKLNPSEIVSAVARILIGSLALVLLVSLPLIDQPRISGGFVVPVGGLLLSFGILLNAFVARELARVKFRMEGLGIPERLVTTGLFGVVRHPSSLGILSMMVGWYFVWGALYCVYFVSPIIAIGIFIENRYEERNLERNFGDEYRTYKTNVGMYFPRIGGRVKSSD